MIDEQIEQVRKAKTSTGISRLIYEVVSRLIKVEKYIKSEEARTEKMRTRLSRDAKDASTAMRSVFEDMNNMHSGDDTNPIATIMMAVQKFNDMSKEKMDRVEQFENDGGTITYDKVVVTDEEVAKLMDEWADKSEPEEELSDAPAVKD